MIKILKNHQEFLTVTDFKENIEDYNKKCSVDANDKDYLDKLFKHDFMYDPKISTLMGNFL